MFWVGITFLGVLTAFEAGAKTACEGLERRSVAGGKIVSAKLIAAGTFLAPDGQSYRVPSFCRVRGIAKPTKDSEINFEVWLPDPESWNGRYYQHGRGGGGGAIDFGALAAYVRDGAVGAATDDGHVAVKDPASPNDWARFSLHRPQKVIDLAYRALRETTLAAKAAIRVFYGKASQFSYFEGCSGGGHYAWQAAQRYPDDWDGVLVGAPSSSLEYFAASHWNKLAWLDPQGRVSADKIPALERAALASCTSRALVQDGIPTDPRFCFFDPAVMSCEGTETKDCLTESQIAALRKIYHGPQNPRTGEAIYLGFPPTSESAWIPFLDSKLRRLRFSSDLWGGFYQYIVFDGLPKKPATFDFDSDLTFTNSKLTAGRRLDSLWNANGPDLSPLQRRNMKVIMYFGWNDPALTPLEGVKYYERVAQAMGGIDNILGFYRLFMVPGMEHCGGGSGANSFGQIPGAHRDLGRALRNDPDHNILRALEAWVEAGRPPDRIVAAKYVDDDPTKGVAFTRPICPYPQLPLYKGRGDKKAASSFECTSAVSTE